MHDKNILYLASHSFTRQHLLTLAQIPFTVLSQSADEKACDWSQQAEKVALAIARSKMNHASIPASIEGQLCFVLTADTLCIDTQGIVHGKPRDLAQAYHMIKNWRSGCSVITAFCLEKRLYSQDSWIVQEHTEGYTRSSLVFSIPDERIDDYLTNAELSPLLIAGAVAIEGYGAQFVQSIEGSYTGILGLPLFEVREALTTMGFFNASPAS